jgi:hypothetical protein
MSAQSVTEAREIAEKSVNTEATKITQSTQR